MNAFPESLHAETPAEGHLLARKMAEVTIAENSASHRGMASHLSTRPEPSAETLTALYFHTITAANGAWRNIRGPGLRQDGGRREA